MRYIWLLLPAWAILLGAVEKSEPGYMTPIPSWKLKDLKPLKLAFCSDGGSVEIRERLHAQVDRHVEVGSTFISFGAGSSEHAYGIYPSRILEPWWSGVSDEELSPDQRKSRDLLLRYYERGTDPLTIVIERAHQKGLKVFAEFRVNRYAREPSYGQSSFFHEHPELLLKDAQTKGNEHRMNWARPEVREHHLAFYTDLLERYDVDGIDLEFRRAVPFFEKDEPDKVQHMNEFMKRLRQEADRIGARRNKHISIAIQCLWDRESQTRPWLDKDPLNHGLDYATWAKEGYVDILIPTLWSYYNRVPGDVSRYKAMVQGTKCKIYAYVVPSGRDRPEIDLPTLRELAKKCDGLYIFNGSPNRIASLLNR